MDTQGHGVIVRVAGPAIKNVAVCAVKVSNRGVAYINIKLGSIPNVGRARGNRAAPPAAICDMRESIRSACRDNPVSDPVRALGCHLVLIHVRNAGIGRKGPLPDHLVELCRIYDGSL